MPQIGRARSFCARGHKGDARVDVKVVRRVFQTFDKEHKGLKLKPVHEWKEMEGNQP